MLKVGRSLTIPNIERLTRLARKTDDPFIQLPLQPRHRAAGGEASYIQFLLAWSVTRAQPALQFWKKGEQAVADHDKLIQEPHGIIASVLAESYHDSDGLALDTDVLRGHAISRLDQLYGATPESHMKGPAWATLCADDLNRSAPQLLYSGQSEGDPVLRNQVAYATVVDSILTKTFPVHGTHARRTLQQFHRDDVDTIGAILYEIFRNTDDHGLFTIDGSRIPKSVRGIYAQNIAGEPAKLAELVGEYTPLADYCRRLPIYDKAGQEGKQTNLLEISTFDAGSGFAETFRRKPIAGMTHDEELEAVQTCFGKNQTSKGRSGFGQGLYRVLRLLKQKNGFLRLRTGRLSLWLDLAASQWNDADEKIPDLNVWTTDEPLALARGTVVSIFVPLRVRA